VCCVFLCGKYIYISWRVTKDYSKIDFIRSKDQRSNHSKSSNSKYYMIVDNFWIMLSIALALALTSATASDLTVGWSFAGPSTYATRGGDPLHPPLAAAGAAQVVKRGINSTWYLGSVNGGVWKTNNLDNISPNWVNVLDNTPVTCSSIAALHVSNCCSVLHCFFIIFSHPNPLSCQKIFFSPPLTICLIGLTLQPSACICRLWRFYFIHEWKRL
jgi:hypothetical protein